jgi:hypothetical protein
VAAVAGAAAAAAAVPSSSLRSSQILWLLELPRVDQISGVTQQFAEEKVRLDFFHCGWLQGGEVVPHDGGPVVAETHICLSRRCCRTMPGESQRSSRAGGPRRSTPAAGVAAPAVAGLLAVFLCRPLFG